MKTKPEPNRALPVPYVDETTGQRFYNVWQAAQMVEGVSKATLWLWAKKGFTSFGLPLDVQREPMIHDPRGYRQEAKTHRKARMMIPEKNILILREVLQAAGRDKPAQFTDCERDALRAATRRYVSQLTTQHL